MDLVPVFLTLVDLYSSARERFFNAQNNINLIALQFVSIAVGPIKIRSSFQPLLECLMPLWTKMFDAYG
jgi:hypothetical protein